MKQQDVLSILITFVVGFVGGGYLYVSHFSKILQPDSVETVESINEFVVIGEAYGSCGTVCPSFQVLKDGSYRYKYTPSVGQESVIKEGTLPLDVQRSVKRSLEQGELVAESQPVSPSDCNSRNDGIDIRYDITLDGAEYTLDSCGTNINDQGEVWTGLAKIWNYFRTLQ